MKRIACILTTLLLLTACSSNESVQPPQKDWTPQISRSATGGNELRIEGRKDGNVQFSNILIPASDGGNASWKDNIHPDANNVNNSAEFIAFAPAENSLPTSVTHDGVTEYFVDYAESKPNSFTMHPLMSQLKLHVWVEGIEGEAPQNTQIYMYAKADLDFPNKGFKNHDDRKRIYLGEFVANGEFEENGRLYYKYSMKTPLVVIPQTLSAGEEVLWFTIKDAQYYLKPKEPIQLKPDYITSFTISVTYVEVEEDEEEGGEELVTPPAKKVIAIDQSTVTITSWQKGETINGNIYNSDNN